VQRAEIADHVEENPSLKSSDEDVFASAYRLARLDAVRDGPAEANIPVEPPFTREQALDEDY
jgi:hypothetical protein